MQSFFAALFDATKGQGYVAADENDRLTAMANPWAQRDQRDVGALVSCPGEAQSLREEAGPH
eukprot:7978957-Pyramimonas_sp.AAC.1